MTARRDRPWERPGYRFSIGWPPMFQPQGAFKPVRPEQAAFGANSREAALARGDSGTLDIGRKNVGRGDVRLAARRRGAR